MVDGSCDVQQFGGGLGEIFVPSRDEDDLSSGTQDGSRVAVAAGHRLTVAGGPQVAVAAFQRIVLAEPGVPGTAGNIVALGETITPRPGVQSVESWTWRTLHSDSTKSVPDLQDIY